jgi:hypothetical protein
MMPLFSWTVWITSLFKQRNKDSYTFQLLQVAKGMEQEGYTASNYLKVLISNH